MKKFRLRRGFTLAELLIAVMLLGFVSLMVSAMTSAILSTTASMQEVPQAEILGNEALENIQGELRLGKEIEVKAGDVTDGTDSGYAEFLRQSTNMRCTIALRDGKVVINKRPNKTGEGEEKEKTEETEELFDGSAYGNLKVSKLSFSFDSTEGTIGVSVEISYGVNVVWSGSVSVRPLNGASAV